MADADEIDRQLDEPATPWSPGQTSAVISGVLLVFAIPMIAFAVWALVSAVTFEIPATKPGFQRDEDAGFGPALAYLFGIGYLTVGGTLLMGAAGLYLRPGCRGRVMLTVFALMVIVPIVETIALVLKAAT